MSDDHRFTDDPAAARPEPSEAPPAAAPRRRRRHWLLVTLVSVVVVPVALFALWIFITLTYTYSIGHRAGYVQKFSKKGWLCKTWEGELAMVNLPGTAPTIFGFSVRDDSVAHVLERSMGSRVSITYAQHRGVPVSCFGETEYFVTGVQVLGQ